MSKIVIVADDLTGANATCSLLKKNGLKTASLLNLKNIEQSEGMDVISYATDSRGIGEKEAYDRVRFAVSSLKSKDALLYNKRIDSTLRGNLGSEIDAMLDELNDNRVAIVVPAFPDSERKAIKGTLFVNGKLLEYSDAAKDPKTPITTSCIEELFKKGTRREVSTISIVDVAKGVDFIAEKIKELSEKSEIIIFDAITNNDLIDISKAVLKSEVKFITVDPGPFTMYLSREILFSKNVLKKVLMTVGSVTDTTKTQLEEVMKSEDVLLSKVDVKKLIDKELADEEITRVVNSIKDEFDSKDIILVTSTPMDGDINLNLKEISIELGSTVDELSHRINRAMGVISKRILTENKGFAGVFSSGGDITVALCDELDASGIEIKEEVVPLAAYGRIIGGEMPDLKIVTKGGMVGDRSCMKVCIEKIRTDINQ